MKLSELFAPGKDTLVIYSMMFPRAPDEDLPCPSCTQFLDSFDGVVEHASQRVNVAIVAKAALPRRSPMPTTAAGGTCACSRRRQRLQPRLPRRDARTARQQLPMLNVFRRDGDAIRHFWGSELLYEPPDPGQDPRHAETIDPLWNLFDFAPEGRGTDWYPSLSTTSAEPCAARRRAG